MHIQSARDNPKVVRDFDGTSGMVYVPLKLHTTK